MQNNHLPYPIGKVYPQPSLIIIIVVVVFILIINNICKMYPLPPSWHGHTTIRDQNRHIWGAAQLTRNNCVSYRFVFVFVYFFLYYISICVCACLPVSLS